MITGPHNVYIAKQAKESFGLDWTNWLASGETILSVSTAWTNESGGDASSLETGSPTIDGSIVYTTKDENVGTPGSHYFVVFTATTSTGRILGGDRIGTIKLRIPENF